MRGLILLFPLLFSCGEGQYGYSINDVKATSAVFVSTLGNVMDETSGGGFSFASTPSPEALCLDRAGVQSCVGTTKSITYNGCESSDSLLTGSVSLIYSDGSCAFGGLSSTVTRTVNMVRDNSDGSREQISSTVPNADYRGETYGSGSKVTTTGGGYSFEILGKQISRVRSTGLEGYDLMMKTTSAISLSAGNTDLRRDSRVLSGGTVEMANNRLEYLTTYTIASLTYQTGCCHPTSGTINFTISEGAEGSGQIQFNNSCGSASLTLGDVTETMFIEDCNY